MLRNFLVITLISTLIFLKFNLIITILWWFCCFLLVSSGTITINDDSSVQILAEEAVPLEWLDLANARETLIQAQSDLSRAQNDVARAEAQIAVEVSEALVQACQ